MHFEKYFGEIQSCAPSVGEVKTLSEMWCWSITQKMVMKEWQYKLPLVEVESVRPKVNAVDSSHKWRVCWVVVIHKRTMLLTFGERHSTNFCSHASESDLGVWNSRGGACINCEKGRPGILGNYTLFALGSIETKSWGRGKYSVTSCGGRGKHVQRENSNENEVNSNEKEVIWGVLGCFGVKYS